MLDSNKLERKNVGLAFNWRHRNNNVFIYYYYSIINVSVKAHNILQLKFVAAVEIIRALNWQNQHTATEVLLNM